MLKKTCRWLGGRIGYLLYSLALLVLVLWLLFPKMALHRLVVQHLNGTYPWLNWQVQSVSLQVPEGVMLRGIEGYEVHDKKKPVVRVDLLTLRPDIAGIMKMKRLQAAYRFVVGKGVIAGTLQRDKGGKGLHVDGSVQGLQLAECAMLTRQLERELQGTVAATFSGTVQPGSGNIVEMEAKVSVDKGRLGLKQPVLGHADFPFSRAAMTLQRLGKTMQVEQGTVDSELLNGQFAGEIQWEQGQAASQLDIRGTLQPRSEFFKGVTNVEALQAFRAQLKNGTLPFRISGNLYNLGVHFGEFSQLFQSLEKELK